MTTVLLSSAILVTTLGIASTAAGAQAKPAPAPKPAAAARTITIEGNDAMKFSPAAISAKPGETIRIVLKGVGTLPKMAMSHNFVLLTLAADATTFANEAMKARATEYMPPARKGDVIAATGFIGNKETTEVTFKVPTAPGVYTFICTFPGHFVAGMKGTLTVK